MFSSFTAKLALGLGTVAIVLLSYVWTYHEGRSYEATLRDAKEAAQARENLRLRLLSVEEFSRREAELEKRHDEEVAALEQKMRSFDDYTQTVPSGGGSCLSDSDTRELRKLLAKP